jgi:hypothetical protein
VKRNDSFPTPGQLQMALLFADGALGPPVQPFFFRRSMTFFWLKLYFAQFGL